MFDLRERQFAERLAINGSVEQMRGSHKALVIEQPPSGLEFASRKREIFGKFCAASEEFCARLPDIAFAVARWLDADKRSAAFGDSHGFVPRRNALANLREICFGFDDFDFLHCKWSVSDNRARVKPANESAELPHFR